LNGVFSVALVLTAAVACVALSAPLLLQEALAWRGGRAASVRLRSHTCTPACATSAGAPLVAGSVRLSQPTLWSEHALRACELRIVATDGTQYLLPVPPTQLVREGQSFAVRKLSGRHVVSNCTTGVEMVLPRRLVAASSPLSSLAALPLLLIAPFALLFVFVGNLGRGVTNKIGKVNGLTGSETPSDIRQLATESDQMIGSGVTWLIVAALVGCGIMLLVSSSRWPSPRVLTTDGLLRAA
jgi:hypothetical protein